VETEIRFATTGDLLPIMEFIRANWKEDHILALDKDFFLYEFYNGEGLNFVIGTEKGSGKILGICGFIQNSKNIKDGYIWGSVWKVIKTGNPTLGFSILNYITEHSGCKVFSSVGIERKTIAVYEFLRYHTGKLKHYYRLNDKSEYSIAKISEKVIPIINSTIQYSLKLVIYFDELAQNLTDENLKAMAPYKDKWYLEKRYFRHPIFTYKVYGIDNEKKDSFIFTRVVECNGAKVLRIVDFIGDTKNLNHLGQALQSLIQEEDYEYIDIYNEGIDSEVFSNAGFRLRDDADPNIIPNYFEPFVRENKDILFFTSSPGPVLMFKGDGDQDRPGYSRRFALPAGAV
jgi:hypothetical protein